MKTVILIIGAFFITVCLTLLILGLVSLSKKNKKSIAKIEFVVSAISAIIGAFAIIFSSYGYQDNTPDVVNNDNKIIEDSYNTTIDNSISQYNFGSDNDETIESLLLSAEACYDSGNFERLFELYGDPILINHPAVNTNLGYIYANGIHVKKNLELAEKYYDKAIEDQYDRAYSNKLAMYFNNPDECFDKIVPLIDDSYMADNDIIALYVGSYMSKSSDLSICKRDLAHFCNSLCQEEKESFVENMFDSEIIVDIILSTGPRCSTRFTSYLSLGQGTFGHSSGLPVPYYKYIESKSISSNLQILDENFVRTMVSSLWKDRLWRVNDF